MIEPGKVILFDSELDARVDLKDVEGIEIVKCAYEMLAEDKPCPKLLEQINTWDGVPEDEKYKLDNPWGHFLWWREKFFSSEKKKRSNDKRSSCI